MDSDDKNIGIDLFGVSHDPRTPIANEVRAHFNRGGSQDDAVALIAALERVMLVRRPVGTSQSVNSKERGTRLLPKWEPSADDVRFAIARGLKDLRITAEAEKFKNYWTAKSGPNAIKRDWGATWRNWIIKAKDHEDETSQKAADGQGGSRSDAILAGMGKLAARIDQKRRATIEQGRRISHRSDAADDADADTGPARRD
jgi:hypothetical protein